MNREWLVVIQDRKDAGEKRMTSLPAHLAGIKLDPKDMWKLGGFSIAEHVEDLKDVKLTGSALICRAVSKDVIETRIKSDAFYKDGVWDPDTLVIVPFVSTMRQPL
ncbi:hypothetical protein EDB81DRAFT_892469 [Dactylonectria macrodidyma]|uniref:YCII-related domain-containing protein n=1 Tax=Dactylonectria macrodidyma TaxID=307937 RepID=A0A9P9D9M1_9HYPO|nr:hypothetical protein EDB81DRAFT_892469 [Dactylonectria macrodidyma]